jgi:hypothetical protein
LTKDPRRFYVYCYIRSKDSIIDLGTGILRNMSAGGRGAPDVIFSKERRRKISAIHKGAKRSDSHKQILREARQREGPMEG